MEPDVELTIKVRTYRLPDGTLDVTFLEEELAMGNYTIAEETNVLRT